MNRKKIVIVLLAVFLILSFFIYDRFKTANSVEEYEQPTPEEVAKQYFDAWNRKDYPNMYSTISDGFKKIEPTAKDLASFKAYAESQGVDGVRILSIEERPNNGMTAAVDYSVEFLLSNGKVQKFDGTFTLKYRHGDVIPGWKLIHPYGKNVDTS